MKDLMQRQVNEQLKKLMKFGIVQKPPCGWVHVIREALGMTTQQLAKRLGVVQQRISALEQSESLGVVKLKTLEEAARALNCRLVYFLLPNEPLENTLKNRAVHIAKNRIDRSSHSMSLEDQSISPSERQRQIEELAKDLLNNKPKEIWNDE